MVQGTSYYNSSAKDFYISQFGHGVGDPQTLCNLLSNALRCTQRGSVLVAARRRGADLRLEIWDTGIGIAEPDLTRIFEEFVQLDNPERDRRKGLGLGLSIAQRSASLLKSAIHVCSRPGRGSRFSISQPIMVVGARAMPPSPAEYQAVAPRTLPVLIVDDDPEVRRALAGLLDRWGVANHTAADADAALALIDAGHCYGAALIDYRLPGSLNGLDLIGAIIARASRPACTLITADFDPAMIAAAREAQVPIVHKPLSAGQLHALVTNRPPD